MDSSMIGKIEKARRYAEEARDRVVFEQFRVTLNGDNDPDTVTFEQGQWGCSCHYFATHGICSHSMAMQRVLEGMLMPAPVEVEAPLSAAA